MDQRSGEVGRVMLDAGFWLNRRVFVTGHTGFKGAWLSLMLSRLRASTTGFALNPPTTPALFDLASASDGIEDNRGDICDLPALHAAMMAAEPEIVIHMAAQPLVRASYDDPVGTYATNVMGTVNTLEAARLTRSVRAVVIVTTDKCYENTGRTWGYVEGDTLGGHDPYSNSKACAELVTAAYRDSFAKLMPQPVSIMSARAGNVIGGGDFATDRIIVDAARSFMAGQPVVVRNPRAVRPWQHVLEPLSGYLLLAQEAILRGADATNGAWNFGPRPESEVPVEDLLTRFMAHWGEGASWLPNRTPQPHEAALLRLDSAKAQTRLGWEPLLSFDETVAWTAQWYKTMAMSGDVRALTLDQVDAYLGQRVRLSLPATPASQPVQEPLHASRAVR